MAVDITPKENPIKISKRPEIQQRVEGQVSKIQERHPEVPLNVAITQARDKAASEIIRERLRKELGRAKENMAKDPLTGLGAKILFEEALSLEIANVDRDRRSSPLEVTVMDLDSFGRFNKERGTKAGDEVLRTVGQTIINTLRTSDQAFRIGGEELVVISRRTHNPDKRGERLVSERHNEAIRNARSENGYQVTVSAGQTDYIRGESLAAFYKRANTALLVAKDLGKDRAVIGEVVDGEDVYTDTKTNKRHRALFDAEGKFVGTEEIITNG